MTRSPTRIGRYDLITALATGGMGRIYLARATGPGGFERKVVVKTLEIPVVADNDPAITMFLDEARLLGLLHHQHIASVFEVGRDDEGRHYMVLDYLEGVSAHDVWERVVQLGAALPLDFTLTVVSAAANGLHYTHTRKDADGALLGIVHRDVTPSNVMIGHDGAVKLIDFGIAMAADRQTKTQTGFVKGKVGYLSPEQVGGRDVDARSDVFSLGILLYELSTLHRAFRDSSDLATMQRIKLGKVIRPSLVAADYLPELEAIVMKALQVEPRDRFASADEMRRAIEALGHRLHLVLGDAAVIEVMAQLFDPGGRAATPHPPSRSSDPAIEWAESDHDLTVRRDPMELLAAMRAESATPAFGEAITSRLSTPTMADARRRTLRAATEAADALIIQTADASASWLSLPSAAPAVAARPSAAAAAGDPPAGDAFAAEPPGASQPAASQPVPANPMIGASLVLAQTQRTSRLRWIGASALLGVLGAVGYVVTRDSSNAAAGSAAAPMIPSLAARPHVVTPAPAAPWAAAAPPPAPTKVHVRIVTHPADATVLLDGKKLGHTPLDELIDTDPGKHVVKLRHRGYTTHRLDVDLAADITQDVTLSPQK